MKRLLCKWIPVCAMGAVLCACGGGVADGDYVSAFKEYVKSELKSERGFYRPMKTYPQRKSIRFK